MYRPLAPDHDVVVVGSGFAGLGMAIELKRAGLDDFLMLEKADAVGGTWRDNHYPGCACDIQSQLYSFSFAPNPAWSRMYAPQQEIRDYLEDCTTRYGIRPHLRLGAEVTAAELDEDSGWWTVDINGGENRVTARVLVTALGGLSRPSYPDIAGLDSFAGTTFHSADWDHDYDFDGKDVAVVGTGASAIQFVPHVARRARRLHLFQRTPPWIMPQPDRPFSAGERRLFARRPATQKALRLATYLIQECLALGLTKDQRLLRPLERVARAHIARHISDPAMRRALTPNYTIGCKRILVSNDYYPALGRDNVELVTDRIAEITERGVRTADGAERPVDALIFGTGFRPTEPFTPLTIRGRGGRDVNDAWREGLEAYLGTTVAGFPNLFLLVGPNTGTGHQSQLFMIESQIRYVMDALRTMRGRRLHSVDVRPEVQADFNARLQRNLAGTVWSQGGCNSWYLDSSGRNTTLWPGFSLSYQRATRRFDAERYELVPERPGTGPEVGREPVLAS